MALVIISYDMVQLVDFLIIHYFSSSDPYKNPSRYCMKVTVKILTTEHTHINNPHTEGRYMGKTLYGKYLDAIDIIRLYLYLCVACEV